MGTIRTSHDAWKLELPASLLATWRFRSAAVDGAEEAVHHHGKGLTGTDLRLWLYTVAVAKRVERPYEPIGLAQADISRSIGRVQADRVDDALHRLGGTEVWTGKAWAAAIAGSERRRAEKGNRWSISLDAGVVASLQSQRGSMVMLDGNGILPLSSRYSLGLYLRYLAWCEGHHPDRGTFKKHPKAQAFHVQIPYDEIGQLFAFGGALPPSKVEKLFVTQKGAEQRKPVVQREFAALGLDLAIEPTSSDIRSGIAGLAIWIGRNRPVGLRHLAIRQKWAKRLE